MTTAVRDVELALAVGAELGEGPVWDERAAELYFVDILGRSVHAYRPADGAHRRFAVDRFVGAVALREDGGLVLAAHDVFLTADRDGGRIQRLGHFAVDGTVVRFNDGKVDPHGRFVAGTMHFGQSDEAGALYALDGDARVRTLLEGVTVSNGLAWSADGSLLYYIDSPTKTIDAFDVHPETGALANRRAVARIENGSPDGMAIDDEGLLWVAVFEGARVERIDPARGTCAAVVRLPTPQATSVAFAGPALDQLYVTTAREGFSAKRRRGDPHAGDLFVVSPGVSGPPARRFALAPGHVASSAL